MAFQGQECYSRTKPKRDREKSLGWSSIQRRQGLYQYLRLATCASLILFGAVIAGGVMALVPSLLERATVSRAEIPPAPACASSGNALSRENCAAQREVLAGADVQPIQPTENQASSEINNRSEGSAPKQAAALPDQPTASAEAAVPVPPAKPAATSQLSEVAVPMQESVPQQAHAAERAREKAARETKPRLSSDRKAARRERVAERRTHKALGALRRFEEPRRDIPMSAYAAEGLPRRIIIRPTSIQDVYYYSARPWE
jgi:hypothetical protein